jgi:hypothetical protein
MNPLIISLVDVTVSGHSGYACMGLVPRAALPAALIASQPHASRLAYIYAYVCIKIYI